MKAIEVNGNRLLIHSDKMRQGKAYRFEFLGVKMVAVKHGDGDAVDLYQEIDNSIKEKEVI